MNQKNSFLFMIINNLSLHLGIMLLIVFGALCVLYYETYHNMVMIWLVDDNYSHGFFIPFVVAYLIWDRRDAIRKLPVRPANSGFFVLVLGLMLYVAASIGAELFTMRFSSILVVFSLVVIHFGWRIACLCAFPIMYLIFMIPLPMIIWNKIAFPLKLFATKLAVMIIKVTGTPVYGDGNIIYLTNTTLEVVDACSGLRSLISLLALTGFFVLISVQYSAVKKMILFISAVPIAVALNVVRLTITALLARQYGPEVANGFLHDFSGFLVFAMAVVIVLLLNKLLSKIKSI